MRDFLQDPTVVQFVISPVILAAVGAVGWIARSSLKKIQEKQDDAEAKQKIAVKKQEELTAAVQWIKGLQAGSATSIEKVREHVVNSHSTNLRDDVDRVSASLNKVVELVQQHATADKALSAAMTKLSEGMSEIKAGQTYLSNQVESVTKRLDAHIDRNPS